MKNDIIGMTDLLTISELHKRIELERDEGPSETLTVHDPHPVKTIDPFQGIQHLGVPMASKSKLILDLKRKGDERKKRRQAKKQ